MPPVLRVRTHFMLLEPELMRRRLCTACSERPIALKRPKDGDTLCVPCFSRRFEDEVHATIVSQNLFAPGDVVASGASGGKDSTVLMHLLKMLNERHNYGIKLILVSVDEGIVGYRDDSLKTVYRNAEHYGLPLHVVSYKSLFGWTMDEIVAAIGNKSNCTYCGVFRRQALDRGAALVGANKIVTGHNADDMAETILMNILRADTSRLLRCSSASTGGDQEGMVARVKPLKGSYEKEIVLYAHFHKLDYFTTECTYSKEAFRGNTRTLLKQLEALRPACIDHTVRSGEDIAAAASGCVTASGPSHQQQRPCKRCGYAASQDLCRACSLLDTLNLGGPKRLLAPAAASSAPPLAPPPS